MWVQALTVVIAFCSVPWGVHGAVNGGVECAACTIAVGLIDHLTIVHNETVNSALGRLCDLFPDGMYKEACRSLVDVFGFWLIMQMYHQKSPDYVCEALGVCYQESGQPQCHLFPIPKEAPDSKRRFYESRKIAQQTWQKHGLPDPNICSLPFVKTVCTFINRTFGVHVASADLDGDGFSSAVESFRGYDWRGRDCDDFSRNIYPGASTLDQDVVYDGNCNGIYGRDRYGTPYESYLCNSTASKGVVTIGDSASAHFHLPPQWLMADKLNKEILETLPFLVQNEFDWPHMSATTGFRNVTWSVIEGPVDSIYLRLRNLNRCNHRDYQNLCVNGADSFKVLKYVKTLKRNQTTDNPVLAAIALVGNDVCNHFPDSVPHMTTPAEMEKNMLHLLQYLDTQFPKGSHIVVTGLADGRVLYNSLHNRLHPFGRLMGDIKYPAFYEYLKCLQVTPCAGWMTVNETLRNLTSQRAAQLSKAIEKVIKEHTFKHFTVSFISCPLMKVIRDWEKKYGRGTAYQLIEPIDGFHPNQYAQAGIAEVVWKHLKTNFPNFLGIRNPFNTKIEEIFGDQGGH